MELSDYKFCNPDDEVKAVVNGDSWSVMIGGKIVCDMSSGGCQRFRTETQALVAGRHMQRGYSAGAFLSADVENYIN
tara:strand:+ start:933 stop:1163 length:231 start_codon:yes stop_codon:yes gene_type:complete